MFSRFNGSKLARALKGSTGIKPSLGVIPKVLLPQNPLKRNFHSSVVQFHKLDTILSKELIHEKKEVESNEVDEEFEEVKKIVLRNFKIKDKAGEGYVYLTRKFNDEDIVVQFDCQNEADPDDLNDEDSNESDVEDEEGEAVAVNYGVNFEVIITRNDSKLVIDCVASKDLKISNIQYVPTGRVHDEKELYSGPRFNDLDDDLREEFYNYLEERGIDNELSFFLVSQARYKEEREYLTWLEKVGQFTSK